MHPCENAPVGLVWAGVIGCMSGFVVMAVAVANGLTDVFDRRLLLLLRDPGDPSNAIGPPWFEETAAELTALGGYPILTVVLIVVLVTLVLLEKRGAAGFLLLALCGGALVSTLFKRLFDRPRPDIVDHLDLTFTSSFPSAHAMMSMMAWLTMALMASRFIPRRALRRFMLGAAVFLAIVIGTSRVYLGVHWPSDVAAGWLLGAAWSGGCWLVAHYAMRDADALADLGDSTT